MGLDLIIMMLGLLPFAAAATTGGDDDDIEEDALEDMMPEGVTLEPLLQALFPQETSETVGGTETTGTDGVDVPGTDGESGTPTPDDGTTTSEDDPVPEEGTTSTPTTITGTVGDDSLPGTTNSETIFAGPGSDTVDAGDGDDGIDGGEGNDTLNGGLGDDTILGSGGDDVLLGNDGADLILGGDGADSIEGGSDNDSLLGGDGADTLNGGLGNDTLDGDSQNGADNVGDVLDGQVGDDSLYLGTGDIGIGGEGADSFYANGTVQISDFNASEDMLIIEHTTATAPTISSQALTGSGLTVTFSDGTVVQLTGVTEQLDPASVSYVALPAAT
ncbi:calcium-binding protein [Primorskyibacter sp. 2E107]|uniref:calcium-binding protein n=1 Tax=Primorskyibacter sp. 2E107 TaxID=3403458 RepID=UPI003AF4CCF8